MLLDYIFIPEQERNRLFAREPDLTNSRADSKLEKIFANRVSDKELLSRIRIYKELFHNEINLRMGKVFE